MYKDLSQKSKRPPAVASLFYPGDIEELRNEVRNFLNGDITKNGNGRIFIV